MKRKRLGNSIRSGRKSPSNMMGDASGFFLKKNASLGRNKNFQNFGNQFNHLFGAFIEHYIKQNPSIFIPLFNSFSPGLIAPPITISNANQTLNLTNEFSYKIIRHIGCLKAELIAEIHASFHNHSLTGTSIENFIPHFLGGVTKAPKIIWLREDNLLTFTFLYLMEKLIPYFDNPFQIIAEHFCDSKGNDYTSDQLRKSHSKGVQKRSKTDMIEKAFSILIRK